MKSKIYFQPRTAVQDYYYGVRAQAPPGFSFFEVGPGKLPDYLGRYLLMNELHRRLHPFQFVRPGDTVVHVGFDRVYLEKGQSHPLILSALVGDEGRVLAVDPDRRNTDALRAYAEKNNIKNLEVVNRAAWKETTTLEFIFDGEWSPMSVATDVMTEPGQHGVEYVPGTGSRKESVQAETLDAIVARHLPDRPVTYLSLTANGAEPQVVEGAQAVLRSSPDLRVGIALAFRHFSYDIRKQVCQQLAELGFDIVVADAQHDPWRTEPFYFACAVKLSPEKLSAFGLQETTWEKIIEDGAAKETRMTKRTANPSEADTGFFQRLKSLAGRS